MSDDIVRKAVREVVRNDLVEPTIKELFTKLNMDQISGLKKEMEKLFYNKIEWLEDPEAYYFSLWYIPCECEDSDNDVTCTRCIDDSGILWNDEWSDEQFEEVIKNSGGLAINVGYERLQHDYDDILMTKSLKLIFTSNPLFVKYFCIDEQFSRYILIWPAPTEPSVELPKEPDKIQQC